MSEQPLLRIEDLHVSVGGKQILNGLSLTVNHGELHAVMGPNGSGKSTLANALMGHPGCNVTSGRILFQGVDLVETAASPDERAKMGMFLGFQYPTAIPGVTLRNFLRTATAAVRGESMRVVEFRRRMLKAMESLRIDRSFMSRYLNDGFSGGEKKRVEILQMAMLEPLFAVLDETDSGLDIDALRVVSEGINALRSPERGVLLITHYQRILNHVVPDRVHVLADGRIAMSGGLELARRLETEGYEGILSGLGAAVEAG